MKFAHMSHIWRKPGMAPADRYAQLWRELQLCDDLGFDYAFCVEHHTCPTESMSPSPPLFVAGAAARTRQLRLGAMGWLAPLYDPLRVAEEVVALDNATAGRLDVGLVSGVSPDQLRPYKGDYGARRERTIECYEVLKAACASPEGFSYEGPYHQYANVPLQMAPYQQPRPPVWLETRDPATLSYCAKEGIHTGYVHYLPRQDAAPVYRQYINEWRAAGHPEKPNVNYWILAYVDETDDKAWEVAGPSWVQVYTEVQTVTGLIANRRRRGELGGAVMLEHFTDIPYMREHNIGLIGSPETVAAKLRLYAEEGLFNTLLGEFNFGYLSEEQVMRSLRLFGEEVMPRLRDYEPY
ncbi:MAG TPA: LLM class flavin-dependent oxidoreductase [Chloroflexota bacterium]|jgi:alkanesulfonate monooxygenase SsuD/methylene tetrahydromethanopterin reductase-like flavin-dependent oxidoreductase (luciferase family)